jgi:16S rRNA (guanine966-N2)-methyltransferase
MSHGIRITGGRFRGRHITIPKHGEARYTSSVVRGAIFNRLGDIEDVAVLDLFAGAGSFAIEALSRGAARATLVESDRNMSTVLRQNLADLSLNNSCEVLPMDVRQAVPFLYRKKRTYDIIFMDPPYEKGYVSETIALLRENIIYHAQTIFVLEHTKKELLGGADIEGWDEIIQKRYGDTIITMLKMSKPRLKE